MSNGYISLERDNDSLALMGSDLLRLEQLAQMYGWRHYIPDAGDGESDDPGEMSTDLALALAEALTEALSDVPDHDARSHKVRPCAWAGPNARAGGWLEEDPEKPLSLLEIFSGDEKDIVQAMAAFCRGGGFRVVFSPW